MSVSPYAVGLATVLGVGAGLIVWSGEETAAKYIQSYKWLPPLFASLTTFGGVLFLTSGGPSAASKLFTSSAIELPGQ